MRKLHSFKQNFDLLDSCVVHSYIVNSQKAKLKYNHSIHKFAYLAQSYGSDQQIQIYSISSQYKMQSSISTIIYSLLILCSSCARLSQAPRERSYRLELFTMYEHKSLDLHRMFQKKVVVYRQILSSKERIHSMYVGHNSYFIYLKGLTLNFFIVKFIRLLTYDNQILNKNAQGF